MKLLKFALAACLAAGSVPALAANVTGSCTATGTSSAFMPKATAKDGIVPFNVSFWGTFVGTAQLERSFDSGTTWILAATARTAADTFIAEEPEAGVIYRINCSAYTSGTINYRISK